VYTVLCGDRTEAFEERKSAISEALRISSEGRREVTVEDTDGVEWLVFRGGELTQYRYETRRNMRRQGKGD